MKITEVFIQKISWLSDFAKFKKSAQNLISQEELMNFSGLCYIFWQLFSYSTNHIILITLITWTRYSKLHFLSFPGTPNMIPHCLFSEYKRFIQLTNQSVSGPEQQKTCGLFHL